MTCSLSLICQTNPPALPWTWSGSMRNHCGTAARITADCAAWDAIAVAAAEGFFVFPDLVDFLVGIIIIILIILIIQLSD